MTKRNDGNLHHTYDLMWFQADGSKHFIVGSSQFNCFLQGFINQNASRVGAGLGFKSLLPRFQIHVGVISTYKIDPIMLIGCQSSLGKAATKKALSPKCYRNTCDVTSDRAKKGLGDIALLA